MFESLQKILPAGGDVWQAHMGRFKQLRLGARTTILKEGEIPKKLFFVEKGCLRAWLNHHGKEITVQFFLENGVVASIESFRKNTPSPFSVETIEPSKLWWIHKRDLDPIIEEVKAIPPLRDGYIDAVFERTFEYMKLFLSAIKDTPVERYEALLKERPQIIKRIPQHYIASYLGISSVHLSRIKTKLRRGNR